MTSRTHSDTIEISAPADAVYDLVSDVTRTGEWSPICRGCDWDEGATGEVGDVFTGHNEHEGRSWSTRSQVVAAERGREFAWVVGEGWVRWTYTIQGAGDVTQLTESWEFTDAGQAMFAERFGDDAGAQIEQRTRAAHEGIPATLAAIKRLAEDASAT